MRPRRTTSLSPIAPPAFLAETTRTLPPYTLEDIQ